MTTQDTERPDNSNVSRCKNKKGKSMKSQHTRNNEPALSPKTIRAWWYRPTSKVSPYNIGDETTSFILEHIFDTKTDLVDIKDADLISAGSILQNALSQRRDNPTQIVGTGFVASQAKRVIPEHVEVQSVRGYLTREAIDVPKKTLVSVGDPGLLASELKFKKNRNAKFTYGVIPHISSMAAGEWKGRTINLPNSTKIDVRTKDIFAVLEQMYDCEVIVSESLHGLIFADSLGIENVWLGSWDTPVRGGDNFKFFDYFSSIGRSAHLLTDKNENINEISVLKNISRPDSVRIRNVQSDIHEAFNKALDKLI